MNSSYNKPVKVFLTILLALCVGACGSQAAPEPETPRRLTKREQTPEKGKDGTNPVVAPPPAYGNKVVRAETGTSADAG